MARIIKADQNFVGLEPDASLVQFGEDNYVAKLMRAMNWYSYEKSRKEAKAYLLEYAKHIKLDKPKLEKIKAVDDKQFNTSYSWLARLKKNGAKLSEEHSSIVETHIEDLLNYQEPIVEIVVDENKAPRISIQEAMAEKTSEWLGELEGQLDEYLFNGKDFNLYAYLKGNQVPHQYTKAIVAWLQAKMPEIQDAINKVDEQLVEGYSNFTPSKLKKYLTTLQSAVLDVEKYAEFKKVNKKPRVKKEKPAGVQVAKLKYKKEDTEYGIKSVPVAQIIGANMVWVFNTKNKRLAQYVASGPAGISVKGTKLMNFNPEESKQKTLRKPDEVLPRCIEGGKLVLRKLMSEIKAKEADVNGRITEDMIILKVTV